MTRKNAYWDDLRFPASAVNPPGQPSDPDVESDSGCFLFAPTGTELVYFQVQLPHGYAEYTPIVPHVHWQKTTSASGNVVWEFAWKYAPLGGVMDAAFTTTTASTTVGGTPDNDTADEHLITSAGEWSFDDCEISNMFIFRLSRLGSDASDTYGADARMLEFDIHYQRDRIGSAGEFYKVWRTGSHR